MTNARLSLERPLFVTTEIIDQAEPMIFITG
jgi:hypothetical protein